MIKAIFFDVDDTMYDHLYPFKQAIKASVAHIDNFPFEAAYHRMRYYGDKLSVEYGGADVMAKQGIDKKMQVERFQFALADFAVHIPFEQAEHIQHLYLATQFNISIFPNMDHLLTELKHKGYIVGLLTNGAEHHQSKKIAALKLEQYINRELIFISGAIGIDKPNPTIFDYISDKCNLSSNECLYIGDSWRNDVVGATGAGWNMVWFNHRKVTRDNNSLQLHHFHEVQSIEQLIHFFKTF